MTQPVLPTYSATGSGGLPLRPDPTQVSATPQFRAAIVEADSGQIQTSDGTHWYDPMGNVLV